MTHLSRRDPMELPHLSRVFNQLFNDPFFGDVPRVALASIPALEEGTLPLDISEDEKHVIVRASLPGFSREDVSVEIHEGVLSIKAEQTEESVEKGETFYRKERRVGSLSRRVALPSTVVEGETHAELKDGVLTLRLPKVQKATPRKIKIG